MKELDFHARYGKGTWALVTGATDGIGWGFCQKLAPRGFNVVLVSRTESKLQGRVQELEKEFGDKLKFKYVVMDFGDCITTESFQPLKDAVKDLDISLLINNVGFLIGKLCTRDLKGARDLPVINFVSTVMLSHIFIQKFRERKLRLGVQKGGGIINIGSINSMTPSAGRAAYSGIKAACDFFSRGCTAQYSNDCDILAYQCGYVTTTMSAFREKDFMTTSVDESVDAGLKCLGQMWHTYGHIKHGFIGKFFELLINTWPDYVQNVCTSITLYTIGKGKSQRDIMRNKTAPAKIQKSSPAGSVQEEKAASGISPARKDDKLKVE